MRKGKREKDRKRENEKMRKRKREREKGRRKHAKKKKNEVEELETPKEIKNADVKQQKGPETTGKKPWRRN